MTHLVIWWLAAEILGIAALPFTFKLFKNLPDRGYAFSKAIGILLPLYFVWLVISADILPNSTGTILAIIALLASGSFFIFRKNREGIYDFLQGNLRIIITVEGIFLFSFILLAVLRSYTPQICGTEKPMDFAFLNALLRADQFPPPDPWLSGYTLNNYYLGHLIVAIFTKITATPPEFSFNIALCLFFALCATGIFSLVFNLIRLRGETTVRTAVRFGILGCVLFLVLGNLEGMLEVLYARGIGGSSFWEWVGIKGLSYPPIGSHWLPDISFWWWRSTRVIDTISNSGNSLDYTITEYPSFSFILGDLHAHVMSLPFTLLAIAISLNIFLIRERLGWNWIKKNIIFIMIMLICLGALGAIHSWDLPTYTLLFLVALFLQVYITRPANDPQRFRTWFKMAVGVVILLFVLYLPFYLNMNNPVMGVLPWRGTVSQPFHYLLIFGLFFFITISLLVLHIRNEKIKWSWNKVAGSILITALPLILWGAVELAFGILNSDIGQSSISIGKMVGHLLPLLIMAAFILFSICSGVESPRIKNDNILFILSLIFISIWITIGCELFYIGDVFNNRMNTIFRFYYQSWTMLALASTFGVYYLYSYVKKTAVFSVSKRVAASVWQVTLVFLTAICLILPLGATYDRVRNSSIEPTLDGLAYLEQSNVAEWEAINWLNENVNGIPVIVEATGNEYTQHGRISVNTGLPTILGWAGHELVWRGQGKELSTRSKDIDIIYQSNDVVEISSIFTRYQVSYVYLGYLEKARYGFTQSEKFSTFMDTVFENEEVTIYRVRSGKSST